MFVVSLIEEHVLSVTTLCGPFLEDALLIDPMFGTKSLPIDSTHFPDGIVRWMSVQANTNSYSDFRIVPTER